MLAESSRSNVVEPIKRKYLGLLGVRGRVWLGFCFIIFLIQFLMVLWSWILLLCMLMINHFKLKYLILNGLKYLISFIEHFSRYGYNFLIANKSSALNILRSTKPKLRSKLKKKIEVVISNRGGELWMIC